MTCAKRFVSFLLLLSSLCSATLADVPPAEQPTSVRLEQHLELTALKLEEMQERLEVQARAYEAVFLNYETSIKEYEAENATLSRKYAISRNVTLVVTTALLATILAFSLGNNN